MCGGYLAFLMVEPKFRIACVTDAMGFDAILEGTNLVIIKEG